ncbi:hypothetical protein M2451_002547 [Dysgonomonas sp. PFB1-18]|uniref:hypothetical protein n=1 Tax=unclassified Dysgonomonas TaxID=2630389 RepID=UPI00247613F4|nr:MULTISPECIES: hypothetical protein [unclassified Dysgonomonas]MDH6308028.1 hypothetical protein [Dysgonomonas sp. PF1-14]MDH6339567.1 hypothetical protein [Dysgonomonas sp. PF1-16]MDH6381218.1 hypothetical protein [Dysgonomonas sp. PFB1-18]MDH6398430.1 hypothetical protein [Dysgonomonas sp. PF1-23]
MVGHQTARECISSNYRTLGTWKYEFDPHTDLIQIYNNMNAIIGKFYIIEMIDGEEYNVGTADTEKEANEEIEKRIAFDAKYGRDTRDNYSWSTNQYN